MLPLYRGCRDLTGVGDPGLCGATSFGGAELSGGVLTLAVCVSCAPALIIAFPATPAP